MRNDDNEKAEILAKDNKSEGTTTQTFTFSESDEDEATLSDQPSDAEQSVHPAEPEQKRGSLYKKIAVAAGIALVGILAVVIGIGRLKLRDTVQKVVESSDSSSDVDSSAVEDTQSVSTQTVSEPAVSADSSAAESSESAGTEFMEITYTLERDDRSGTATAKSGLDTPYSYYYDQVRVNEEIPNADIFNAETERRKNEFFSGDDPFEIITNGTDGMDIVRACDRYVTYRDCYVGDGILSVYLTYEWVLQGGDGAEFAGYTFDFRTGEWVTFDRYLGVTEEEARLLAEEACERFCEKDGRAADSIEASVGRYMSDGYDTSKFFISEDGKVFLVNDRIGRRMEVYEVIR